MSTETIRLIRNWGSPGQPPRLSHSSWALNASSVERVLHIPTRWWTRTLWQHTRSFSFFVCPLPPCHLCGCRPQVLVICFFSSWCCTERQESWCRVYSPQKKGSKWKRLASSGEITGELFSGSWKMLQKFCTTSGSMCVFFYNVDA